MTEKGRRQELLRAWKEAERRKVRSALPLPDEKLDALFSFLSAELSRAGCDKRRTLTERWLADQGIEPEPILVWLDETGGYCDCEALANSEEVWRESLPRRKNEPTDDDR